MSTDLKCIYYIHFTTSNKGYVGQTNSLERRMKEHRRPDSGCRCLSNAIQCHGFDDCDIYILEDELGDEEANNLETFYIRDLGTLVPNGYNLNEGGDCSPMAQETKDLISKTLKEKWKDPELRLARSDTIKSLWTNEDFKAKQMATRTSESFIEKMKASLNTVEHMLRKQQLREEKSKYCREVFVRLGGDRQKTADKLGVSTWTITEFMRPYQNDEDIVALKKQHMKNAHNAPDVKEKKKYAQMCSAISKDSKNPMKDKLARCREVFVRLNGDTQKIIEELGVSSWTYLEYMKHFKDDDEIQKIRKEHRSRVARANGKRN
ncbi:GIY-YIG catalytic domain-containing endonuclease [Acanthocystis turfacea Chlorella virus NE-JV-3]|nr:GIY-YIG catalytic domain-containing endonuclease [Acanthocystis turfacea Chlorella virus NE-JV-3]